MIISRIGFSPTGTKGLGNTLVKGERRVPLPPAKMTACIWILHNALYWLKSHGLYRYRLLRIYSIVYCNPCSNVYCGFHSSISLALVLLHTRTVTSLFNGRKRLLSATMGLSTPIILRITPTNSLIVTPWPVPTLKTLPILFSDSATLMKPDTVSSMKVKSRTGVNEPSLMISSESAWLIIVGMTARADWYGPYVLKGLIVVIGRSNEQ